MNKTQTPLLDTIHTPEDLRRLTPIELPQLAAELRHETISVVSETGGHLGAGLGVVELTVALHYIFDTPHDRLIWDVGHQAYPHKILTQRRAQMRTIRQYEGLSGFTKRSESIYDPFGAGHSSTSISAGLGMAQAFKLQQKSNKVITVIGDGALSAGMAYEALNNAGAEKARLIVILNDNDMSIAPPTGAMSAYLARLASAPKYRSLRNKLKHAAQRLPRWFQDKLRKSEEYARGLLTGGTLFEELGFYYIGPIDGHNLNHLLPILKNVAAHDNGPVLIHVVTEKGKGYSPAEASKDKYHGVVKFDIDTGEQQKTISPYLSYTDVFARSLTVAARQDPDIVAITAAMPDGTGLTNFAKEFPERFFDVGIAEQHAVTFAAGLACEGLKPFVAIYSTFLQRAYDQIVHDVSIQKLPVKFAIDRAGVVGADGATHSGSFDITFLSSLPGFVVMAPGDGEELAQMIHTASAYNEGPIAFRFPRNATTLTETPSLLAPVPLGKGRLLKTGGRVALLSFGSCLATCLTAAAQLDQLQIATTVADARFAKPLDTQLVLDLLRNHEVLITVEEGSVGGFSAQVLAFLTQNDLLGACKIRTLYFSDLYPEHGSPEIILRQMGVDAEAIVQQVYLALGKEAPNKALLSELS